MRSSAVKKTRLLSGWTLLGVTLLTALVLVLTFHGKDVFMPGEEPADQVSISYAQVLLKATPEDTELRMKLIDQLIALGRLEEAQHQLELLPRPLASTPFYAVELDILQAESRPQGLTDADRDRLAQRLGTLDIQTLSIPRLQRLAERALQLAAPGTAARYYLELAQRDTPRQRQWLEQAARWSLASGQQREAARLYLSLASLATTAEQRQGYRHQAFDAWLAAGQGAEAAALLEQELPRLQPDAAGLAWLKAGVAAAQGSGRLDLAQRIIERWRQWEPDNPAALEAAFRLALASGDTQSAWTDGQQLLALRPEDDELLAQLAQLGEWNGHVDEALDLWLRLLARQDDPARRDHAWKLAARAFRFDAVVELLGGASQTRQLDKTELDSLIFAYESLGDPVAEEQWLRGYIKRQPKQRLAWERLQQLLSRTEQDEAAAAQWAVFGQRFPLSTEEYLTWAQNLLQLFKPEEAWAVLERMPAKQRQGDDYWRLRADLAWELERDTEAQQALERLAASSKGLTRTDEERLLELYQRTAPQKALVLLEKSWEKGKDQNRLTQALQWAEQLKDSVALERLLASAARVPASADNPAVWLARAGLDFQRGRVSQAETGYRQALERFPDDDRFRERLLWLLIDQNRQVELATLLRDWQGRARDSDVLWLPFGSGLVLLGQAEEGLVWYRRYLAAHPQDWLVQAAYADALDAAGHQDAALRLRKAVTPHLAGDELPATPERYATYLRLLTSLRGPQAALAQARAWQDGSPSMLQLWFDQWLDALSQNNDDGLKGEWLAWAKSRGLKVRQYEQLQEVLRRQNRGELEKVLAAGDLDPAQRVEVLQRLGQAGDAQAAALTAAGDEPPEVIQRQLLRQATEQAERTPNGVQAGWERRDYGGLVEQGTEVRAARRLADDVYADVQLKQDRVTSSGLQSDALGNEHQMLLKVLKNLADGGLETTVDASQRSDSHRIGLGVARTWRLDSNTEIEAALDWHRQPDESGYLRALGRRDSVSLAGRHNLTPRDQLSWRASHNRYSSRDGDALGSGFAFNLELSHLLFFEGPTWQVRSGVTYQQNKARSTLPDSVTRYLQPLVGSGENGEITAADLEALRGTQLLQDRYGQLYVGSSWRRGIPGSLNRTHPQYTWLVDTLVGWQWTEREFNYGLNVGLGMAVLGDDELAFTAGYQSAPQGSGGQAGSTLGIQYSNRIGR
ncbi:tetratricopeptide repeat protein [Pseudomonas oryzihabitans]|uniref:tetratricopeptide repeat protein n=1 Tax=Pseudomonas oryzihabitans TaxID=47885 RepID=UPI00111C975F|nr:tetratricopeptide repeat protein [Pseudomonas psychrotolerans]QDD90751.1 PelB [Pseudomonas psychrotolerans]